MNFKTNLMPHQEGALEKLLKYKVGALFMEQGTGKTRTALEFVKRRKCKISKVWWLCPASLIKNTKDEFEKHVSDWGGLDVEILSLESFGSSKKTVSRMEAEVCNNDFVIIDESSFIKNQTAKRSSNINRIFILCRYKLILNGTPLTNGISDLFNQMFFLSWKILNYRDFESFARAHLEFEWDDYGKRRVVSEYHIEHLNKLSSPFIYQCLKKDIVDITEKKYFEHDFSVPDEVSYEYQEMYDEFKKYAEEEENPSIDTIRVYLTKLRRIGGGYSYYLKRHFIKDKLDFIKKSPRSIIFCSFRSEIEALREGLGERAVYIDGEMKIKDRQKAIDIFKDYGCDFLVIMYQIGSFGLNLQFADSIIFFSPTYHYGHRIQAEDRIHRIGQEKDCFYYSLVNKDGIESRIRDNELTKEKILKVFRENERKIRD